MCECIDAAGFVAITHAHYVPVSCANPPAASGLLSNPVWLWCSILLGSIEVGSWELMGRLGGLVQLTSYENYLDFVRWSRSFQDAGWI